MIPLVPFSEMLDPEDEFVSVVDIPKYNGKNAIFQAFIACVPKHPIILHALKLSFYNIMSKREDIFETMFHITGPIMFGQCINIFWNKDCNDQILPGKYGNINLNYKLVDTADYIIRVSDGERMFQNRYEGYSRVSDYTINQTYKTSRRLYIKKIIKTVTITIVTIFVLMSILVLVYKMKYENCRSQCSRL